MRLRTPFTIAAASFLTLLVQQTIDTEQAASLTAEQAQILGHMGVLGGGEALSGPSSAALGSGVGGGFDDCRGQGSALFGGRYDALRVNDGVILAGTNPSTANGPYDWLAAALPRTLEVRASNLQSLRRKRLHRLSAAGRVFSLGGTPWR